LHVILIGRIDLQVVDLPHTSCAILNVLDGVGRGGTQESGDSGKGLHFDFEVF